jgi:hypothetical protein
MGARTRRWPRLALIGLVAMATLGVAGSGATAAPPPHQEYQGTTTQGLPIDFVVGVIDQGIFIPEVELNVVMTCEVTGTRINGGFGFFGFPVKVENGQFRFDYFDGQTAVHWSGSITKDAAAGLLTIKVAALTPQETAQLCSSGDQAWKASPVASAHATGGAGTRVTFTRHDDGSVTRTETTG